MKPAIDKNDPRLDILLFGPRVGKTRSVLELAEAHNYVLLISTDHGTNEYYYQQESYEGYIRVYECWRPEDVFKALSSALDAAKQILNKGSYRHGIWIALDTVTHLHAWLKTDADKGTGGSTKIFYERLRSMFFGAPCNTISICAETESGKPALWSPKGVKGWAADADICARMEVNEGERFYNFGAGFDKTGYLDQTEKANVLFVRNKLVGENL